MQTPSYLIEARLPTFTLTPEDGATRFKMREEYRGPDLQPSFEKLTEAV